ncbi:clavesin-2 [Parasteatoda tepidariorum]|uniref:clavesin-2 n=1 Tax=Parasteatoda tepidariorum TaxID=114398 RepID=UPI001C71B5D6|nr:clavesin-2 [Parasteatoda tepidariorum]XP_042908493.1 clavesin-2 [Parasteatoda tepidariorum]XP_042908494.1 clavesin-2 [Parasteatoda tepidariorum]XP_042908495.1 clavesin-2 [Parasteatoda tepidariorum]
MDSARTIKVDGAVYRPLLDTTITKEDLRKAKQELNERPEERRKHVDRVRKYLSKEKDLNTRTDEEFLVRFLRARKFNDERAANLVKDHYRYRSKNPRLFQRPKDMEDILRCNIFNYLSHRDPQGRAIFLMKIGLWCTESYSFKEFVGAGNILSHWVLKNPVTQINGYVGIWDFKDYSFQHFSNSCSPRLMWMLSSLMQDCFPGRFKVAYCVNCPPLADVVWKLFKPLIREKYRKRIVVIGNDMTELHKYIHPSVLPEEYGGELPPSDSTEAVGKLMEMDSEWDREKKYGYRIQSNRCKDEDEDQDIMATNAQEEPCIA